jgi:hypothetical protein
VTSDAAASAAARPRLGVISFVHRFGSALDHHVHLHVCATETADLDLGPDPVRVVRPDLLRVEPVVSGVNASDLVLLVAA